MDYLEIKQPPMFVLFLDILEEQTIVPLKKIEAIYEYHGEIKISTQESEYTISLEQFNKLKAALKDFTISLED